uniref:Uncharacterized protein n=1 Tax=Anguilla anguilla TaxID=7936 RepID=A0A0E9QZB9_ANGAN
MRRCHRSQALQAKLCLTCTVSLAFLKRTFGV